jgi:hypothetical protein
MAIAVSSLQPYLHQPDHTVYLRRRLLALLLGITAAVLGGLMVQKLATAIPAMPTAPVERQIDPASFVADLSGEGGASLYVAQPGDSMWSIATSLVPYGETAKFVDQLVALNGGATLSVGQRVVLPER